MVINDKGLLFLLGAGPGRSGTGCRLVILSKACEYAIRAVLLLATMDRSHYVPVRRLAKELDISAHFLSKICHDLTQHGLLVSQKGPNGGVALGKPPEQIRLIDVVEAIDGLDSFQRCVLGLEPCGDEFPCPVHASWAKIKEQLHELLTKENIQTFAEELSAGVTTLRIERP